MAYTHHFDPFCVIAVIIIDTVPLFKTAIWYHRHLFAGQNTRVSYVLEVPLIGFGIGRAPWYNFDKGYIVLFF